MADLPVIIAGGGIGGLSVALTLQQIGVPCIVLEAVEKLEPLGVGINLQPNAVRELYELGIGPEQLDRIGVQAREWALVGLNGKELQVRYQGACGTCPSSTSATLDAIQGILAEQFDPEIQIVPVM